MGEGKENLFHSSFPSSLTLPSPRPMEGAEVKAH